MVDLSRFFGLYRRRRGATETPPPALDELMENHARRLQAAQPDTERQWQYLNVVLQRLHECGVAAQVALGSALEEAPAGSGRFVLEVCGGRWPVVRVK